MIPKFVQSVPHGETNFGIGTLAHVPAKPALGLDPMGGHRFADKDMRQAMSSGARPDANVKGTRCGPQNGRFVVLN